MSLASPLSVPLRTGFPALWRASEALPHGPVGSGAAGPEVGHPGGHVTGRVTGHLAGHSGTGFAALDQELPGGAWPCGQLVELLIDRPGIGELGLVLPALRAIHEGPLVWVLPCADQGPDSVALPYAPALVRAGIDLGSCLFVRPLNLRESAWAMEQALRAPTLGALVAWLPAGSSPEADFRCLRRLHLLAQRHRAPVFILRPASQAASPSPATLRLRLEGAPEGSRVHVLKRRGRPLLEPVPVPLGTAAWGGGQTGTSAYPLGLEAQISTGPVA
jgi:hypothetical protein